jgi:hypothetical protein
MARTAIILYLHRPGSRELRLGHILDFFGVPYREVDVSELSEIELNSPDYVAFGSIQAVAAAIKQTPSGKGGSSQSVAFYAYTDDERDLCVNALRSLSGNSNLSLKDAPAGNESICVSRERSEIAGPMVGLTLKSTLRREDSVLTGVPEGEKSLFAAVISAGRACTFLRFERDGVPLFFCTSSYMVDIDEPIARGFYDVKDHFFSVAPLVMFIRFFLQPVAWRPQELGACLIVDDPLLRLNYGFCDFVKLRDLMRQYGFTTNIAFIPWNWRRTSRAAGDFFRNEAALFSVSIHGCDHTAGEFGATALDYLDARVQLGQARMKKHEARTGVHHESIMVFPQGVFSSACPEVLKRHGFLAAVNTETIPVDSANARTRVRDVWDVAIMSYGSLPIFTRRYAFHGLENFAFDLLLGKPCLIVAHHNFFKDGGVGLIELLEKIGSLNCSLRWRSLGALIRRSCRRRARGEGFEDVEMFGSELYVDNPLNDPLEVNVHKREISGDCVSAVQCDGKPVSWAIEGGRLIFGEKIPPRAEKCFRVVYREQFQAVSMRRSLPFELSVATRRILSELRDDYLSRNSFLNASAQVFRNMLKPASRAN